MGCKGAAETVIQQEGLEGEEERPETRERGLELLDKRDALLPLVVPLDNANIE